MSDDRLILTRESLVFVSYLTGRKPSDYVLKQYVQAHRCGALDSGNTRFEQLLIAVARQHRFLARVADAYARFFASRSALRKKLVLLLAVLETSAPSYVWLDDVPSVTQAGTLAAVVGHGMIGVVCLVLGFIIFTPMRLLAPSKKLV